jgi:signal transduction histidine kinase
MIVICSSICLVCIVIFAISATSMLFSRITKSSEDLLARSITIAWQEYNRFFDEETRSLSAIASVTMENGGAGGMFGGREKTIRPLKPVGEEDFLLAINAEGALVGSTLHADAPVPEPLRLMTAPAWRDGKVYRTSELLELNDYRQLFPNELLRKARVPPDEAGGSFVCPPVLIQITAVPVYDSGHTLLGCIAGGEIINNDRNIGGRYSRLVPNSFLTIAVNGLRISSNIATSRESVTILGKSIPASLFQKTSAGERYTGQAQPEPGVVHLVVSDPLRNGNGEVIGSLTIGIFSQSVTNIKRDTMLALLLSMLACLCIAFIIATLLSKKMSRPLANLSRMAEEIIQTESILKKNADHLAVPIVSRFSEIGHLQQCFSNMTTALYKKNVTLEALTSELQQVNNFLEYRVKMRTDELQRAVEELKILNNLKNQFLANMSHELRTPLNSIIGFSEMLCDEICGELNQTQKEHTEIVLASANHLLKLINDILDLSSIEQEKVILDKQWISCEELISSAISIMSVQTVGQGLSLKHNVDAPDLYIDVLRIKQVLYNLLSNAIKFTQQGGIIEINAIENDSMVEISVSDTGTGIEDDEQQYVFDEFYQGGCDLYKRKFGGVGLGLPLSKKLIALHGGTIELKSAVGKGTTVTCRLPINGG